MKFDFYQHVLNFLHFIDHVMHHVGQMVVSLLLSLSEHVVAVLDSESLVGYMILAMASATVLVVIVCKAFLHRSTCQQHGALQIGRDQQMFQECILFPMLVSFLMLLGDYLP